MEQELFNPQSFSVSSSRVLYTPSVFARTSLIHLQEVGSLKAIHPHVSKRSNLVSFLCFVVLSGSGELEYEGREHKLAEGDCVFIDCRKAYSHSHKNRDEVWVVISGNGKTIVDGMEQSVKVGDVITMSAGCRHTVIAETELKLIEVQLGEDINVHDKQKFELEY